MPTPPTPTSRELALGSRVRPGLRSTVPACVVGIAPYALPLALLGPSQRRSAAAMVLAGVLLAFAARSRARTTIRVAAGAAAAAVLAAWVVPSAGRLPVASMVAALGALLLPGHPDRAATAPGLVRLLPLAIGGALWVHGQQAAPVLVALAASLGARCVEQRHPDAVGRIDDRAAAALASLGTGVSILVIAIVATPLLLLPLAVVAPLRWWSARRRHRGESNWRSRSIRPTDERRDAARPFAPAPATQRRWLNVVGIVAVAVSGALLVQQIADRRTPPAAERPLGLGPVATLPPSPDEPEGNDGQPALRDRPAFANAPWADEIEAEIDRYATGHLPVDEELGYVLGDFSGAHLNVADGERRTLRPTCECPRASIWLLGGSAAFGWNQRDDHTIASELVRLAEADNIGLEIRNLAVPGWTIVQELGLLERLLDEGRPPPDLVIFYDGFNDAMGVVAEASASGRLPPDAPTLLDAAQLSDYVTAPDSLEAVGGPDVVAAIGTIRYLRELRAARSALEGSGSTVVAALQPDAFRSEAQLRAISGVTRTDLAELRSSDVAVVLDGFERRLRSSVVNVRATLSTERRPVFSDPVHMNEHGARLAARALYAELEGTIAEAAA